MWLHALVLTSVFALGANGSQDQHPASSEAAPVKRVCKRIVPTGTIVGKRICLTPSEWAEFHDRTEKDVDSMRDRKLRGGFDRRSSSS